MRRFLFPFVACLLVLGSSATLAENPPQRILSLSVPIDEMVLSLVDHNRILAVSSQGHLDDFSHVASEARAFPAFTEAAQEAILDKNPDLAIVPTTLPKLQLEELRRRNIHILQLMEASSIPQIKANLTLIAEEVHASERGAQLLSIMEMHLGALAQLPGTDLTAGSFGVMADAQQPMARELARTLKLRWSADHIKSDIIFTVPQKNPVADRVAGLKASAPKIPAVMNDRILEPPPRDVYCQSHYFADAAWNLHAALASRGVRPYPERVVPMVFGATEVLLEILPRGQIAAVHAQCLDNSYFCMPEAVQKMPTVTSDLESVLAVKPDLVISADYSAKEFVALLGRTDTQLFQVGNYVGIAEIMANIEILGRVTGRHDQATLLVDKMRREIDAIKAGLPKREEPLRVIQLSGASTVVGTESTFHDFAEALGMKNVAAENGVAGYGPVSIEQLIHWAPDVIVVGKDPHTGKSLKDRIKTEPAFAPLAKKTIIEVNHAHLASASHFAVEAIRALAEGIAP